MESGRGVKGGGLGAHAPTGGTHCQGRIQDLSEGGGKIFRNQKIHK